MEQILLSQLCSLKQASFHLLLRGNSKKIGQFRKELAQYLACNNLTVQIIETEDNLLTADKVQLASQTIYNNYARTIENIYTGAFNSILFQYVLNHCKTKMLLNSQPPLPDPAFKFKIQPIIRIESVLDPRKPKKKTNKAIREEQDQEEAPTATQRNSTKSNRNVHSSRKNEEDHSKDSINHEYHGRKCYCCSNRSNEDSAELQDQFSIFSRNPKKSTAEDKQNSSKKQMRVSDFRPVNKRASPQPLPHQLSMRGNSSQSDRHQKSPNLYFRKHLQTIANKKEGEDTNRPTVAVDGNKIETETVNHSQSNKWIKTKRNDQICAKICEIDDDKSTQLKKATKFSTKIPIKNDKVFQKAFRQRLENRAQFSEEDNRSNDSRSMQKHVNCHETMKNSTNNTKVDIEQRYSQMIAPCENKLQAMGGYSIDQKNNHNICPGLQKMAHQRNQSLQSWFKNKRQLHPISKIKQSNESKLRNNEEIPMILNRSKQKASSASKPVPQRQSSLNIEKSLTKNNDNSSSSNRLPSNRIKKIPLTQKMQIIKQGQDKLKNHPKQQQQINQKSNANRGSSPSLAQPKMKMKKNPTNTSTNKQEQGSRLLYASNQSQSRTNNHKTSLEVDASSKKNKEESVHEDDNFSVTQERINNSTCPEHPIQSNKSSKKRQAGNEAQVRSKPQNDLASTIKQINYEDEINNKPSGLIDEGNTEPQLQESRIETCRTIPMRNQSTDPLSYQSNQRGTNQEEHPHRQEEEAPKQYFDQLFEDNLSDPNTPKQKKKQASPSPHPQSRTTLINNCESSSILSESPNKIPMASENRMINSSDLLQDSQSLINQELMKSEQHSQSQPSEYSSTTKLQVKQDSLSLSKNRLSIDGQLSPHPNRQSTFIRNEQSSCTIQLDRKQTQSQHQVPHSSLQEFERELFEDAPSPTDNQSQIREQQKCNRTTPKDFLRLQTIDEVNESIYRQNEKKQMEQKLNSVSISSSISSNKLKENLSFASSKMVSQSAINVEKDERISMSNKDQRKSQHEKNRRESLPVVSENPRDRIESKQKQEKKQGQNQQMHNTIKTQKQEERASSPEGQITSINEQIHQENLKNTISKEIVQQDVQKEPSQNLPKMEENINYQQTHKQNANQEGQLDNKQGEPVEQSLPKSQIRQECTHDKIGEANQDQTHQPTPIEVPSPQNSEEAQSRSNSFPNETIKTQNVVYSCEQAPNGIPASQQNHEKFATKGEDIQQIQSDSVNQPESKQKQIALAKLESTDKLASLEHKQDNKVAPTVSSPPVLADQKSSNKSLLEQSPNKEQPISDPYQQNNVQKQQIEEQPQTVNQSTQNVKYKNHKNNQQSAIVKQNLNNQNHNQHTSQISGHQLQQKELIQQSKSRIQDNHPSNHQNQPTHQPKSSKVTSKNIKQSSNGKKHNSINDESLNSKQKSSRNTEIDQIKPHATSKSNFKQEKESNDENCEEDINSKQEINQEENKEQNRHISSHQQNQIESGTISSNNHPFIANNNHPFNGENSQKIVKHSLANKQINKTQGQSSCSQERSQNSHTNIVTPLQPHQSIPENRCQSNTTNKISQKHQINDMISSAMPRPLQLSHPKPIANSINDPKNEDLQAISQLTQQPNNNDGNSPTNEQYPSNPPKSIQLPPQHSNICVQTDYILPNEEADQKSYYKCQSDHLSKKKCKINLCEPEIINTCNHLESNHEISDRQLKRKNRTEALPFKANDHINEQQVDSGTVAPKRQQARSEMKNNRILTTEPSNYLTDHGLSQNQHQIAKKTTFSNIIDNHNELPNSTQRATNQYEEWQKVRKAEFKLEFKNTESQQQVTHPEIINKLIYKNIPIVRAPNHKERTLNDRKSEIIANSLSFIEKHLPSFTKTILNKKRTEVCLFVNNQWMLFHSSSQIDLTDILYSQLREQSTYKCIEVITGMPMRILKDKEHDANNKRLIKSLKSLLEKRQEEKAYESVIYGLRKMNHEIVCLQKVRYFLDSSKQSKGILECRKFNALKSDELCNFEGEAVSEFIQMFFLNNPRYLTLQVDPSTVNTYEIELSHVICYASGTYKFILYEETAKNEYKLIKESYLWLKHKNQGDLTKFLLILEPIPKREGQHIITLRLATSSDEEGNHTNRVVKYQNGGKAKGYQGGYENQKNLYLPVFKEITK